jgi:hypothetical protein
MSDVQPSLEWIMDPDSQPPEYDNTSSRAMADAMIWVSRITTVGLEMALPAVLGRWLDSHFGTGYWFVLGLVGGPVMGFWHLLVMTGVVGVKDEHDLDTDDN